MDSIGSEQKKAQYHEFFTIKHKLNVNMQPLGDDFLLPDQQDLAEHMPYAFKIAAEMSGADSKILRPLKNLGEYAVELVEFLNQQNKKIDLMMSYILQQQDDSANRFHTIEFGGGGLTLVSPSPLQVGQMVELKIFLADEAAGVFCYAEVINCEQVEQHHHISLLFSCIREPDQELLVRASLHVQTLELRARAKQQKNEKQ
ncbi:PilZ domain-containing protein [Aliiglaciecola sp. LCG003]|uniref:PilZ domain-containing protein n=1 Tax=Aliiglaciecola sp. LCG003 TaxID=3053655 RepID=UPI002573F5CD|nr:PilZ domain-containing protein [Aliiglaciecola sp. LCG003]WJG07938.1 PilZ domain-containing protein [Aliiglaciecola sp. LCG003]